MGLKMAVDVPAHVNQGDKRCRHHQGVERVVKRVCCGGSHTNFRAIIRCSVLGMVTVGEKACDYICKHYKVT